MASDAEARVGSLDLIRGVAVLGILAINIAGFAGPSVGILTPNLVAGGSFADALAFAVKFLLFEGKMRALFTMLFGASLVLFVERADAAGRFGDILQLHRLFWLAVFGLLHFYLIWWGDILFLYAACGVLALLMRQLSVRTLLFFALTVFSLWHLWGALLDAPSVLAEQHVLAGTATSAELSDYRDYRQAVASHAAEQLKIDLGGFIGHARHQLSRETLYPFREVVSSVGETLPLMLIGMALFRSGFFTGGWPRRRMKAFAAAATGTGLAATAMILGWAWIHGFPVRAMEAASFYWTALPHLLMSTGYAACLALASPHLAATAIGRRLVAAGRMAFSNYIATSIVMTAIFYGWGLGLAGRFGHAAQWAFVLFGWTLMLAWSDPWLRRFRQGPLEWAWRSLVERRMLSLRR